LHVFAKLFEDRMEWHLEAETFSRCEILVMLVRFPAKEGGERAVSHGID
jgi:hypothetical protein